MNMLPSSLHRKSLGLENQKLKRKVSDVSLLPIYLFKL